MNQAALSPTPALRWGNAALIAALLGSMGIVGVVVVKAPDLVILLPGVLIAASIGAYLFTRPRLNFIVWLGGLALLFSSEPGFQLHEVLYGLYFYTYLAHWYGQRLLLYKRPIINGPVDLSIIVWLVMGLGLGIGLGLMFGAQPIRMRGEAIALTMLAIYFPVKEFCIRDKNGPAIILALTAWIGLWVTVDNFLVARETFAQATQLWEIADVRTSGRELLLTFSGILLLAVLPSLRKWSHQTGAALVLVVLVGSLILTKSRTFWVQFIVAAFILILLTPARARLELLFWMVGGVVSLAFIGFVFLSSYLDLIISGAASRFATLGAVSHDLSLINRFFETDAVRAQILQNPVLGYGFGTDYAFFDIIALKTISRSYSHNGFLAVFYKFGVWGGSLVAFVWLSSLLRMIKASRLPAMSPMDKAALRGAVACLVSILLPAYTSSVFFEDEKIAAFMLILALGLGIAYGRPRRTPILQSGLQ